MTTRRWTRLSRKPRPTTHRLGVEVLEDRTVLAAGTGTLAALLPSLLRPAAFAPAVSPTGEINGRVFNDLNGNRTQDAGEPGLAGATVYLDLHHDGTLDPDDPYTFTDDQGEFSFTGLQPGNYTVAELTPPGFTATFPPVIDPSLPLKADFSDPGGNPSAQGFTHYDLSPFGLYGYQDQWHLSTGRGQDAGHSGPNSFYFGAGEGPFGGGQYAQNPQQPGGILVSSPVDLSGLTGPVSLDFNQLLDVSYGEALVYIVAGDQSGFVAGNEYIFGYPNFTQFPSFTTAPDNTFDFQPVHVDLSPFAGQTIEIVFAFLGNPYSTAEGWYVDDVTVSTPTLPGETTVTVNAGSVVPGVDFGNQSGGADLVSKSVRVDANPVGWGGTTQVHYTLTNQGTADAGPFQVEVRLSSDTLIDTTDPLLTTFSVPGLAAGASVSGTVPVTLPGLPGQPPPGFGQPTQVLVGLRVNSDDAVAESDVANDSNQGVGVDSASLNVLGVETEPNDDLFSANPIVPGVPVTGSIDTSTDQDVFTFPVYQPGRLTIRVTPDAASTLHPVVTLYGPEGQLLASSAGAASGGPLIVQYVRPGDSQPAAYSVVVSGAGSVGAYELTTDFTLASSPVVSVPAPPGDLSNGSTPVAVLAGDLNGDGIPDVVKLGSTAYTAGYVGVSLGVGDGSLRPEVRYPLGFTPTAVVQGDFFGTGRHDLAVISGNYRGGVVVLRNRGDGTFDPALRLPDPLPPAPSPYGDAPQAVVTGDFDHDGHDDLAVLLTNKVAVYLDRGKGTFSGPSFYDVGGYGTGLVAADLYGLGNGHLDLATTVQDKTGEYHLVVLRGNDLGAFLALAPSVDLGQNVASLVAADLTGNGQVDLLSTDPLNGDLPSRGIHVILNRGQGRLEAGPFLSVGREVMQLVVGDFDGVGGLDLAVLNQADDTDLNIFRGNGDGTFQTGDRFVVPAHPMVLAAADFNGDGRPDLIIGGDGGTSVLLGRGDATFQDATHLGTGQTPVAMVTGDFNGDGRPDLLTANEQSHDFSLLLGLGDGTFQTERRVPFGGEPNFVVAGDFNADGRTDFAVADASALTLTAYLGIGDGTFKRLAALNLKPLGITPLAMAAGSFGGDGTAELAIVGAGTAPDFKPKVYLVHLLGGAIFTSPQVFDLGLPAHSAVVAVATGDFGGDGLTGLAVASNESFPTLGSVSVLLGQKVGTFAAPVVTPLGQSPQALAAGDFNDDKAFDLVTESSSNGFVYLTVLLNDGHGLFTPQAAATMSGELSISTVPVVADFNRDGKGDVAIAGTDQVGGDAWVALGNGDGTLQDPVAFPVGDSPEEISGGISSLVMSDLDGNGIPDLAVTNFTPEDVSVLLGRADATFYDPSKNPPVTLQQTPIVQDLDGDDVPDEVIVDQSGQILFRAGQRDPRGTFAPPRVVNPAGRPARAVTVVQDGQEYELAAVDKVSQDAADPTTDTISVYSLSGQVLYTHDAGNFSTAIQSADLNGDGRGDIVVANALGNSLSVFLSNSGGGYDDPVSVPVGIAPGSVTLADVGGTAAPDIVVTNQSSGDVSVLLNDGRGNFALESRYRAGAGPYDLTALQASDSLSLAVTSAEAPAAVAVGDLDGDGIPDLAVADSGSNAVAVLRGVGGGRFANPVAFPTGSRPIAVVAGDFNGDGKQDLAVLNQGGDTISVYLGDGHGAFTEKVVRDQTGKVVPLGAGNSPTGLSTRYVDGDARPDLLVGNALGDVLTLQGNGDGTFQPSALADNLAPLDVQPASRSGQPEALVANQRGNRVSVQAPTPGSPRFVPVVILANGTETGLAPGAVHWQKLDQNGFFFDAVVVAGGSNSVLVYRGDGFDAAGNPTFAPPATYPVGTAPAGVTIADLNGDGVSDMVVANQGSNDVSVLFGSFDAGGNWFGTSGPRLRSGGSGPVATTLRDQNGDGTPDLVITNGQGGSMTVLPGVGQGFFDDRPQSATTFPIANTSIGAPSFFDPGLGVVVAGDGRLVGFDLADLGGGGTTLFAPAAGQGGVLAAAALAGGDVVAALAGGNVVELTPGAGGLHVAFTFDPLTGIPSDPSALAVLQGESGLQVLVTNTGGDRVYVFGTPGVPESPGLPGPDGPGGPPLEVTAPAGAPFALVITYAAGPLPAFEGAGATPAAEGDPEPAELGGGSGELGGEVVAWAPGEGGIDFGEQLRRIDLYQPVPDLDRDVPLSLRRRRPDGEQTLLALAERLPPAAQPPDTPVEVAWAVSPADEPGAGVADVAAPESRTVADSGRGATAEAVRATDTAFLLPPDAWELGRPLLLGLFVTGAFLRPRRKRPAGKP